MGKPLWHQVPGAKLEPDERKYLHDAARRTAEVFGPYTTILNIGVMWGASMHCLRAGAPHARLIGIDLDYDTYPVYYPQALACTLIKGDSSKVHTFRGYGADEWKLGLLFIDGDHTYDGVAADIKGWTPKILPGGMVIFHDYKPAPEDLKRDPSLNGVFRAVFDWHVKGAGVGWIMRYPPRSLAAFIRSDDAA